MGEINIDARSLIGALELRAQRTLRHDEVAAISRLSIRRVRLVAGDHFLREGDPPTRCGFIVDGALHQTKLTGGGAQQIIGLRVKNEFVGLQNLFLESADHDLHALTGCRILEIQAAQLVAMIGQCPALGQILMADVMISCSVAQDWIANLGCRDAQSRVAHLLCELALRIEGGALSPGARYVLPLNQSQLGDALGLGRVAVNRAMRHLAALNMASCDKSCITILDAAKLEQFGDFSARYLHLGRSGRDRRKVARDDPSPIRSSAG